MSKLAKFAIVVSAQLVVILVIILIKVAVLTGGTTVMLRVEPVDPRDLLRGDYMVLRYENVSTVYYYDYYVDDSFFGNSENNRTEFSVGDTVYVALRAVNSYDGNEPTWQSRSGGVSRQLPTNPGRDVYIKGRVTSVSEDRDSYSAQTLGVLYNIEEFFIPEGVGVNTGWNAGRDFVTAEVVVGDSGDAVLKQLYVNGQKWP